MVYWLKLAVLLAFGFGGASGVSALEWTDLPDPAARLFDDPYRDLSPEQFDDVIFVVRLRGKLQQDSGSAEDRRNWQTLLAETEAALAADDIDVDWLLEQRHAVARNRERAGAAGNPALDGQTVTLMGFAIPAPPDADGTAVAYLVPQSGMCSHLPPPPPNQMIRVRLTGGWVPDRIHEPVRLTGRLSIAPSEHRMMVVDGVMPMRATFLMDARNVETLKIRDGQMEWSQRGNIHSPAGNSRKTGGSKTPQ